MKTIVRLEAELEKAQRTHDVAVRRMCKSGTKLREVGTAWAQAVLDSQNQKRK